MLLTKTRLFAAVTLVALTFVVPKYQLAQDAPLEENQKSVVLFDFRVSKSLEEAKAIGIDTDTLSLDSFTIGGPFEGIKISQIKRIFGSASLPENLAAAMAMALAQGPPEKLPFEYFVRIEFTDADVVEMIEKKFAGMSGTVEIGGKEYYQGMSGTVEIGGKEYDRPSGPKNIVAHRVNETTFEMGTIDYCKQSKRIFFTDRVKAAFKTAPNEPTRIVIDLESRADIIKEAAEMGKQQLGDPMSSAYLDLIDNANTIVITSSVASKNLLTLIADGKDAEQAEELASGLDGLLGTAKLGAGFMFGQMEGQMPEDVAGVLKTIVNSLATKQEGNVVKIEVAKPDGFDAGMAKLQKRAQRMNNFRQLGLGVVSYNSAYVKFPFLNKNNVNEDISWRVKILPFVGQNNMYDKMDLKNGPREEPNSAFAEAMPALFGNDGKMSNVAWIQSKVGGFGMIQDGHSNTIMMLENPKGRPWLEDNPLTIDEAVELVSGLADGADLVAVRYDMTTFLLTNKVSKEELRSMFEPNDGK